MKLVKGAILQYTLRSKSHILNKTYFLARYARKNNLPFLKNVTLPRIGAMKAILEELSLDSESKVSSPASHSINCLNKFLHCNKHADEFYIDNELKRNQTGNNNDGYLNKNLLSGQYEKIRDSPKFIYEEEDSKEVIEVCKSTTKTLKYVIDVTVAYEEGKEGRPLELLDIVLALRKPQPTNVLYRLYRFSEVRKNYFLI